jgi:HAD superfamily hydrolase (TIGR01509 family)
MAETMRKFIPGVHPGPLTRKCRLMSQSLHAVLFDMDGTLVDTEGTWGEALSALARELGGEVSEPARAATVGTSMTAALGILYADLGVQRTERQKAEDSLWVQDTVAELLGGDLDWRPGARELLTAVRSAGIAAALVTTTPRRLAAGLLVRMDVDLGAPAFDVTVCGDEVPANKPDPAPYRQAMNLLGVAPGGCVAIEDSRVGAASALAAGAAVLGVPSLQPLLPAPGLVVRESLAGVGPADLARLLAARDDDLAPAEG